MSSNEIFADIKELLLIFLMWLCFEIVLNFLEIHMELFVGEMITGERKRVGVEIQ